MFEEKRQSFIQKLLITFRAGYRKDYWMDGHDPWYTHVHVPHMVILFISHHQQGKM